MKAFLITLLVAAVFVTAALFVQAHIHREIEEFQSDFELLGGFLRSLLLSFLLGSFLRGLLLNHLVGSFL